MKRARLREGQISFSSWTSWSQSMLIEGKSIDNDILLIMRHFLTFVCLSRFIPGYEKLSSAHGLEHFAKTFYTDEKWSKVVQEVYDEERNQSIHGLSDELSSQPTEGSIEDLSSY